MPNFMARSYAREKGEKFYFLGRECKEGHKALRYTSSGACTECTHGLVIGLPATVVMLRRVIVPRKHLRAVIEMVNAFMAMEGITTRQPDMAFLPEQLAFLTHKE